LRKNNVWSSERKWRQLLQQLLRHNGKRAYSL
jgi:hypothetical protein